MARYGLYVDVSRCIGCYSCVVGCKNWHRIQPGDPERIRLVDTTVGEYPDVSRWLFPLTCMHCEHPPCVAVCRFGACHKTDDGIVAVDPARCVGCQLCVFACPYGVRRMNKTLKVADGCDFCASDLNNRKIPHCVESCPTEALVFGDLDDPESRIRQLLATERTETLLPNCRTRPKVFYAAPGSFKEFAENLFGGRSV